MEPKTAFLNVDLDVKSAKDLQPLVERFGVDVFVLHGGRIRRRHWILEVASLGAQIEITIYSPVIQALQSAQLEKPLNPLRPSVQKHGGKSAGSAGVRDAK
jgi:hypothetical protein